MVGTMGEVKFPQSHKPLIIRRRVIFNISLIRVGPVVRVHSDSPFIILEKLNEWNICSILNALHQMKLRVLYIYKL